MNNSKVSYQGIPGAFSEIAMAKYFGNKAQGLPCHTFENLFKKVKNGQAQYGMVPIKNSITGTIKQTNNLLQRFKPKIVGKIKLRIHHNLLVVTIKGKTKAERLKMIKKVYAHPQGILQCQKFLAKYHLKGINAEDNAGSAKNLSHSKRLDEAAIASTKAAKIYKLEILKRNIESNKNNYTTFVIIAHNLRCDLDHTPGVLPRSHVR